jgi:hypothetical protein
LRTLGKAFGETKLREITADQIRAYQAMRTSQKCGPSAVNHECSVLQQMLKRIGKWNEIEHQYQALRLLDRGPGRVLSPEERTRLFQVSARKENWEGAFLFAVLSINTSGRKFLLSGCRTWILKTRMSRSSTFSQRKPRTLPEYESIPLNDVGADEGLSLGGRDS